MSELVELTQREKDYLIEQVDVCKLYLDQVELPRLMDTTLEDLGDQIVEQWNKLYDLINECESKVINEPIRIWK